MVTFPAAIKFLSTIFDGEVIEVVVVNADDATFSPGMSTRLLTDNVDAALAFIDGKMAHGVKHVRIVLGEAFVIDRDFTIAYRKGEDRVAVYI